MDDPFPICGTARLAMSRLAAGTLLRRAKRLHASGLGERARALYEEALAASGEGSDTSPAMVRGYLLQWLEASGDEASVLAVREALRYERPFDFEAATRDLAAETDAMWRWRCRADIGQWLGASGRHEEARACFAEAIAEVVALWGPDHLEIAQYEDELATMLLFVGRAEEAERHIANARRLVALAGFRYEHDEG